MVHRCVKHNIRMSLFGSDSVTAILALSSCRPSKLGLEIQVLNIDLITTWSSKCRHAYKPSEASRRRLVNNLRQPFRVPGALMSMVLTVLKTANSASGTLSTCALSPVQPATAASAHTLHGISQHSVCSFELMPSLAHVQQGPHKNYFRGV